MTDAEWNAIRLLLPRAADRGRRRNVDLREVVNAIRYLARAGCGWRMLPMHFPPWQTVYWWFRRFTRRMLFRLIHDMAVMLDRRQCGRNGEPTAGVLDSQSVKAPSASQRGYDAGKKITGRKRHITVNTDGRLLMINLTPADISDSAGAQRVLEAVRVRWPWIKHLFADTAYDRARLMDKAAMLDFIIEVVRKLDNQNSFALLCKRWVVERSFGWMMWYRRLVRGYERRLDVSESMIYVAMSSLLLNRLSE